MDSLSDLGGIELTGTYGSCKWGTPKFQSSAIICTNVDMSILGYSMSYPYPMSGQTYCIQYYRLHSFAGVIAMDDWYPWSNQFFRSIMFLTRRIGMQPRNDVVPAGRMWEPWGAAWIMMDEPGPVWSNMVWWHSLLHPLTLTVNHWFLLQCFRTVNGKRCKQNTDSLLVPRRFYGSQFFRKHKEPWTGLASYQEASPQEMKRPASPPSPVAGRKSARVLLRDPVLSLRGGIHLTHLRWRMEGPKGRVMLAWARADHRWKLLSLKHRDATEGKWCESSVKCFWDAFWRNMDS